MGKGLFDYAAEHPAQDPPATAAPKYYDAEERRIELQAARQAMDTVAAWIHEGRPVELILYKAVECISLLADDPAWATAAQDELDGMFAGLRQQTLDAAQEDAARRAVLEKAAAFEAKTLRQLQALEREAESIGKAAAQARAAIQTRQMMEAQETAKNESDPA